MTRRLKKYTKFLSHIFYLTFVSYFVIQRSHKIVSKTKLDRFLPDLKHVLIWTNVHGITEEGQYNLINRKCPSLNCYISKNRSLFGDVRYFDAILFNLQDVSNNAYDFPMGRTLSQKYIFAANDSADKYPVCSSEYDDFFNWTWTYRSDSRISYRFISVYNLQDEELGAHFRWLRSMQPLNAFQKSQLTSKSKAAAIFLDQCNTKSEREKLVKSLQSHLKTYNLTVDVFGECSQMKCKKKTMIPCYYKLKKNYYFYLAFEDSFSEDYVTDVVLNGYNNNAVPIVFGGAEYDKFLPPNSYINALQYTEEALAQKMFDIMSNHEAYSDFFRWKNHYSIRESKNLDVCDLCAMLNNPKTLVHRMSYVQFRRWWNPDYKSRCHRFFMLFFRFLTKLRSALEVTNLDYSLGQHHKQVCKKSELPDLTHTTPYIQATKLLDQ